MTKQRKTKKKTKSVKSTESSDSLFNEFIKQCIQDVKSLRDLTTEHAPDVAKEVIAERKVEIAYILAAGLVILTLGLILLFGGSYGMYYFWDMKYQDAVTARFGCGAVVIIGLVASVIGSGVTWEGTQKLSMLKTAPKKYVLTYLSKLVK